MDLTTKQYWSNRYQNESTGWDIGHVSTPLKAYFDQLENKALKILIPGAGNAHEAEYLFNNGFTNIYVLDISPEPLANLQERIPAFPAEHLIQVDFFEYQGQYDLIIEQTFFCSFPPLPETRQAYAKKMSELLKPNGKLVGLYFNMPLTGDLEKRPFGGDKKEYLTYFEPYFKVKILEPCYNSIEPRAGRELFGVFEKS